MNILQQAAQEEVQRVTRENDTLKAKIDDLQQQLENEITKRERAEKKWREINASADEMADKLKQLQNKVDDLSKDKDALEVEVTKAKDISRYLLDAQQKLIKGQDEILDLQSELRSKVGEIEELEKALEEKEQKVSDANSAMEDLEEQLKTREKEVKDLKDQIDHTEKTIKRGEDDIAALQSKVSDLEGTVGKLEAENESKNDTITDLENDVWRINEEKRRQESDSEFEKEKLQREIDRLREELKLAEASGTSWSRALLQKQQEYDNLLHELESKEKEIKSLKDANSESIRQLEQRMKESEATSTDELNSVRRENDELRQELTKLHEELDASNSKTGSVTNDPSDGESTLSNKLQLQINELQRQLNDHSLNDRKLVGDCDALNQQIRDLESKLNNCTCGASGFGSDGSIEEVKHKLFARKKNEKLTKGDASSSGTNVEKGATNDHDDESPTDDPRGTEPKPRSKK